MNKTIKALIYDKYASASDIRFWLMLFDLKGTMIFNTTDEAIADHLNVKPYYLTIIMRRLVNQDLATEILQVTPIRNGRGRPCKFFRLVVPT